MRVVRPKRPLIIRGGKNSLSFQSKASGEAKIYTVFFCERWSRIRLLSKSDEEAEPLFVAFSPPFPGKKGGTQPHSPHPTLCNGWTLAAVAYPIKCDSPSSPFPYSLPNQSLLPPVKGKGRVRKVKLPAIFSSAVAKQLVLAVCGS